MHRVLRAAEFAWGPKAAYEVTFLGCTSRFVRMNQYDVESSVQPPYKVSFTGEAFPPFGPGGSGPCVRDTCVLLRCFRDSQCMYTPRCSFWYESGVHGCVPVVSPACRAVSPMLLDVHVLWRHNCRLSLCCDAPLLGKRSSYRVNWVGVAFCQVSAMMSLPFVFLCSSVFDQNHVRFWNLLGVKAS